MPLGLGLFALAMVLAVIMGWVAASNSRRFDDTRHVSLIGSNGRKNGNGR